MAIAKNWKPDHVSTVTPYQMRRKAPPFRAKMKGATAPAVSPAFVAVECIA